MESTHQAARRLLKSAIDKGKLSHAYLFAGPEGCGKRTLAMEFASSLLCERGAFPPCLSCGACKRVMAGTHPDAAIVSAEGRSIRIDHVRELSERLHLHSFEGGYKVGVIVRAERMTEQAQNAFLKTLEEPPPYTLLVMTGTNLNRVLPTILSRCQVLRLGPLPEAVISQMVQKERGLPADQAALLAALSQGNAKRALNMDLEFVIEFRKTMISELLDMDAEDRIKMLDYAERMSRASQPSEELFDLLSGFYRDVLHKKLGEDNLWNRDFAGEVQKEARRNSLNKILSRIRSVHEARIRAVENNANPRLNWEILTMCLKDVEGAGMTP